MIGRWIAVEDHHPVLFHAANIAFCIVVVMCLFFILYFGTPL